MGISISGSPAFLKGATATRSGPHIERPLIAVIWVLLFAALLLEATSAASADVNRQVVFERADFVLSEASRPPDENAGWQPVSLPHEWRHTHPGVTGRGWYRIQFELAQAPRTMHAVLLTHERSQESAFFVNGKTIGGSRALIAHMRIGPGLGSPHPCSAPHSSRASCPKASRSSPSKSGRARSRIPRGHRSPCTMRCCSRVGAEHARARFCARQVRLRALWRRALRAWTSSGWS